MSEPDMHPLTRAARNELSDDVHGALHVCEQLFERVWAMRERGALGRCEPPAPARSLAVAYAAGGSCACAICGGDHWSIAGEALVLEGTTARVCWTCGDEHNAELTAGVVACAADECEQFVASKFPGAFLTCVGRLRTAGMEQDALDLEARMRLHRSQVQRVKAAELGDPNVWLR